MAEATTYIRMDFDCPDDDTSIKIQKRIKAYFENTKANAYNFAEIDFDSYAWNAFWCDKEKIENFIAQYPGTHALVTYADDEDILNAQCGIYQINSQGDVGTIFKPKNNFEAAMFCRDYSMSSLCELCEDEFNNPRNIPELTKWYAEIIKKPTIYHYEVTDNDIKKFENLIEKHIIGNNNDTKETETFEYAPLIIKTTGRNYDFIATVENTDKFPIWIEFTGPAKDVCEDFAIDEHNWVGILADENGYATLEAFRNGDFQLSYMYPDPELEL